MVGLKRVILPKLVHDIRERHVEPLADATLQTKSQGERVDSQGRPRILQCNTFTFIISRSCVSLACEHVGYSDALDLHKGPKSVCLTSIQIFLQTCNYKGDEPAQMKIYKPFRYVCAMRNNKPLAESKDS